MLFVPCYRFNYVSRFPQKQLCKDSETNEIQSLSSCAHLSVSRVFVAPYLPLDHQVVYRYSPEKVRTLFKNQLDSFHRFFCSKIEHLCAIHVLGVDPRKFLPAGGILRSGSDYAGGANEASLKG